jgi:phasin
MNIALNPEAAADESRERYRETSGLFEAVTPDTAFPQAVRELTETSVTQPREAYKRSKNALEAAVDTVARSFDALGQGAAALNRKIIEIAQQNVNSGFDLAKSLATAKTLAEIVELRATYWRNQFSALATQAEEVRALSTKVAADIATPIKAEVTRRIDELNERNEPSRTSTKSRSAAP